MLQLKSVNGLKAACQSKLNNKRQFVMSQYLRSLCFVCSLIGLLTSSAFVMASPTQSVSAVDVANNADLPNMKTVMQLARERTRKAGYSSMPHLQKWIVPDFPVPANSHDLHGGSDPAIDFLAGTPKQVNHFYMQVLPALGWTIVRHLTAFRYVQMKTCKGNSCVHFSAGSAGSSEQGDHTVRMSFGPKHLKLLGS